MANGEWRMANGDMHIPDDELTAHYYGELSDEVESQDRGAPR